MKTLRIRMVVGILALLGFSTGVAADDARPHYRISAQVDTAARRLTASETVTWTNPGDQPVAELYFHVYPNRRYLPGEQDFLIRFGGYFKVDAYPDGFQPTPVDLQALTPDGAPLTHAFTGEDQTLLRVDLPAPLAPGASVTVRLDFAEDIPHAYGRFGWHESVIKLSRWYPILCVYGTDGWNKNPFYPFHRPFFSEAAYYHLRLTVPKTEVVVHSGVRTAVEDAGAGRQTLTVEAATPVRDFTLAMSPDYREVRGEADGTVIRSFYLPGDEDHARLALESARALFADYSRRFGPYPYPEFSIAPVPLGYGGEQTANMIYIDTRAYRLPGVLDRYFDFLVAHETGHQWIYNVVGVNEFAEMWLEEGFNSYFISQYIEQRYGPDAEVLAFPSWSHPAERLLPPLTFRRTRDYRYKMAVRTGYDHPVVDRLSGFAEPSSIFSVTYGKGSRVLAMLRSYMGTPAFDRAFRRVFTEYRFGNLDVPGFQRICEEEAGQDLDWFFDPWLYGKGHLDYAVAGVEDGRVLLVNQGQIAMPVTVRAAFADGRTEDRPWDGRPETARLDFASSSPVTRVTIDPETQLLDIDRVNNVWPRRVRLHPVPVYWGLYDLPLFLPEDSYNVVVGPEINQGLGVKASLQRPYDQILYGGVDYEFSEQLVSSRVGYQLKNVGQTQTALGVELSRVQDNEDGDDDRNSAKVYLRRELWPVQYGLVDINDHWTVYVIRNQRFNDSVELLNGREDDRNIDYSRRDESIVGAALHLNRSGPYPDPRRGWRADAFVENAGHFWRATQAFSRAAVDGSVYQSVTPRSKLAARLKYAAGYPADKELFYLGGMDGIRGYDRKDLRGASGVLASVEYRFPLVSGLRWSVADHILGLEAIDGVVFFDAGQAWFSSFDAARFAKAAGAGLRFKVNVGGLLEKVVVRLDVAQAVADRDQDPRVWLGVQHAF